MSRLQWFVVSELADSFSRRRASIQALESLWVAVPFPIYFAACSWCFSSRSARPFSERMPRTPKHINVSNIPGKPYSPNFWVIRIILKNSIHTVFFQHTGFYGPKCGKKSAKVFPNCHMGPLPNTAIRGIVFHISVIVFSNKLLVNIGKILVGYGFFK